MTSEALVTAVKSKTEVRRLLLPTQEGGLGLTVSELDDMLNNHLSGVLNEVSLAFEWDFLLKETSTTTTADTSDYRLEGADKDCLQIASIKYDTSETLLLKKNHAWLNDHLRRQSVTSPTYWLEQGRDKSFPVVRIVATPTENGKDLKYSYWRKDLDWGLFPPAFDFVFESCLLKKVIPSFSSLFENDLHRAIAGYTRSGGETNITVLDSTVSLANQRKAALQGWTS